MTQESQLMDSLLHRFRRRYDVPAVGAAFVDDEGTPYGEHYGIASAWIR